MKILALLSLCSCILLATPVQSRFNPIRLPTADVAVASGTPAVLDTDGDELRPGVDYVITTPIREGGLCGYEVRPLYSGRFLMCPDGVFITEYITEPGGDIPVRITPADPNATVVLPSTYLSFSFSFDAPEECLNKLYWVANINYRPPYLAVGGLVSQFKIESEPDLNAYRITYCQSGTDICYNVGPRFSFVFEHWLLALSDQPFIVSFRKPSPRDYK